MYSPYNLTIYNSKDAYFFVNLPRFKIFGNLDFFVNKYYWVVKTNHIRYFYTATDNDTATLNNILRFTRISQLRGKLIDIFFKCILVSYTVREDVDALEALSKGTVYDLEGVTIETQDAFELRRLGLHSHCTESGEKQKEEEDTDTLPDLRLSCKNDVVIIYAYNGSNAKEIMRRLSSYSVHYTTARVYVFASNYSPALLQQQQQREVVCENEFTFKFFTIVDGELAEPDSISIGAVRLDVLDITRIYRQQYLQFSTEVLYWQQCEREQTIIQRANQSNREM